MSLRYHLPNPQYDSRDQMKKSNRSNCTQQPHRNAINSTAASLAPLSLHSLLLSLALLTLSLSSSIPLPVHSAPIISDVTPHLVYPNAASRLTLHGSSFNVSHSLQTLSSITSDSVQISFGVSGIEFPCSGPQFDSSTATLTCVAPGHALIPSSVLKFFIIVDGVPASSTTAPLVTVSSSSCPAPPSECSLNGSICASIDFSSATSSLILAYEFEETNNSVFAYDSSGAVDSSSLAAIVKDPIGTNWIQDRTGVSYAIDFAGTSRLNISVAQFSSFASMTTADFDGYSICFWSQGPSTYDPAAIISAQDTTGADLWLIYLNNGGSTIWSVASGSDHFGTGDHVVIGIEDEPANSTQWRHFCFTKSFNPPILQVYENAVLIGQSALSNETDSDLGRVAQLLVGGDRYADASGSIDEIAL